MAIEAPVPAQQPATFERPPAFYRVWQAQEGIPIHQRFHLESLTEADANVTSAGGDEGPPANQIDYEDEDPTIRELYVRELAARGVELRMPEVQR